LAGSGFVHMNNSSAVGGFRTITALDAYVKTSAKLSSAGIPTNQAGL